jgi:mannan endo-1,4-beta-mannosidase
MHFRRFALSFTMLALGLSASSQAQFNDFVTRKGDRLVEGNRTFRFISMNIPNLHYIEDYLPFEGTNPWRLPDEFEIRDALTAIKQMGGKVARIYVISVHRPGDDPRIIRHVEAPGKFNEEAFRALDRVLQIANQTGVRVIIPFVDNWKWWGGPAEYAEFRKKDKDAFWTDPELRADIKATIRFVITRKNTYTGGLYKDDKAIMAWETGNELQPPFDWTREMAAYVKSLDTNHLVMEGVLAKDLSREALEDSNIDILSTHHYHDPLVSIQTIVANQNIARGKKPYIIGEYGIIPTQDIRAIADTIIRQGLAGGMLWSLRFRNRDGGFYHHFEYNGYESYRWPGFPGGDFYDERMVLSIMREKAYEIDSMIPPPMPLPAPPTLLPTDDVSSLSWQGSAGARSYSIERRENGSADWIILAGNVDDSKYQYRPLFCDESAEPGMSYHYRLKAKNESGTSGYSNTIGPITVTKKVLVDELESFDRVFQKDGEMNLLTVQDIRKAREDRSRLTGKNGSYIMYKTPGAAVSIRIDAFRTRDTGNVSVAADSSLSVLNGMPLIVRKFSFGENDYGFYDAVSYTTESLPPGTRYIKILLDEGVQVSRVAISYVPDIPHGAR